MTLLLTFTVALIKSLCCCSLSSTTPLMPSLVSPPSFPPNFWLPALTDLSAAAPRLSAFRCRLVSRFKVRAGPIWSDFCSATADYIEEGKGEERSRQNV